MPTRDLPWPAGAPCWVDLGAADVAAAKDFYGKVLGWSFMDTGEEMGHYQICQIDGRSVAGLGPRQDASAPVVWTLYLASDDADRTAAAIGEHGGTVLLKPMDVPGQGRMCVAIDSQGATFGVWQAADMIGMTVHGEPGSLVWTDAREPNPDDARRFYSAVFGWTYQQVDMAPADYTTFHLDAEPLGGIGGMMGNPQGTPPHWVAYFGVPDADAAMAAAQRAGATVPADPDDTPFGRLGFITDPQGASFVVVGPTSDTPAAGRPGR